MAYILANAFNTDTKTMTDHRTMTLNNDRSKLSHEDHDMLVSSEDESMTSDGLTGTPAELRALFRELVELTDQIDPESAVPILELQFDDIFTSAWFPEDSALQCMCIAVLLPRHTQSSCLPIGCALPLIPKPPLKKDALLWHADEGCYVIMFHVPIADLSDERSMLDAMLDAAEQAKAWHADAFDIAPDA